MDISTATVALISGITGAGFLPLVQKLKVTIGFAQDKPEAVKMDPAPAKDDTVMLSRLIALEARVPTNILEQLAVMNTRIGALWSAQLRRGVDSALLAGVMDKSSPLRLQVQMLESEHGDLITRIKDFYESTGSKLSDVELIEAIETNFGPQLSELAYHHSMPGGGCAAAVTFLVRPEAEIFRQYDTAEWHTPRAKSAGV